MIAIKIIGAVAAAFLLFSQHTFAHGAARWIMDDPAIRWCCGPKDCTVVQVFKGETGYLFGWHGFVYRVPFNDPAIQRTKNKNAGGEFWGCIDPNTAKLKCLIVPPAGS